MAAVQRRAVDGGLQTWLGGLLELTMTMDWLLLDPVKHVNFQVLAYQVCEIVQGMM